MNDLVVNAAWGKSFFDLFLQVVLPSQLATGNLPALPAPQHTVTQIQTGLTRDPLSLLRQAYGQ
ncbi:MAG: hypothetical protein IT443_03545 [Phycisphaeraceae bacterium]|nr:hypothetical protein [Phycisphaeraceae bacterium]